MAASGDLGGNDGDPQDLDVFDGIARVIRARPGARVRVVVVDVDGGGPVAAIDAAADAPATVAAARDRTYTTRWNVQGHSVIADVAAGLLAAEHPDKHAVLQQIMAADPWDRGADDGVRSYAQWPDRIKGPRRDDPEGIRKFAALGRTTKPDHYQDFPYDLESGSKAFPAQSLGPGRLLDALAQWKAALQSETDPEARATALAFVLHLVGDVHQPLHCACVLEQDRFPDGDQGGNLIWWGQSPTLHGLWDNALVTKAEDIPGAVAALQARLDRADFAADLQRTTFREWAEGSHAQAVAAYDQFLAASDYIGRTTRVDGRTHEERSGQLFEAPTTAYRKTVRDVAIQRGRLAAFRLADLLAEVL